MIDLASRYREFMMRPSPKMADIPFFFLFPLSLLYVAGFRGLEMGRKMFSPPRRLPRPVISVGNITVGGSGKTPATMMIASLLWEEGLKPVILSRGYGREGREDMVAVSDKDQLLAEVSTGGDEPVMMAASLPGVPVWVGKKRYEVGLQAVRRYPDAIFILDDGFQHWSLARDMDVIVVDASNPWGNGALLPAGPLREPPSALGRADVIILNRVGRVPDAIRQRRIDEVTSLARGVPLVAADYRVTGIRRLGGKCFPPATLKGKRVLSFAGIVDHAHFEETVRRLGAALIDHHPFPDHYRYRKIDIEHLVSRASEMKADFLVTTAKDGIKIDPDWVTGFPIFQMEIVMEVEDPSTLKRLVLEKISDA